MHGPCGVLNRNARCMVDGKCSKQFPKRFQPETAVTEDSYPLYARCVFGSLLMNTCLEVACRCITSTCFSECQQCLAALLQA